MKVAGPEPKKSVSKKPKTDSSTSASGDTSRTATEAQQSHSQHSHASASVARQLSGQARIDDAFKTLSSTQAKGTSESVPKKPSESKRTMIVESDDDDDLVEMGSCPVCQSTFSMSSLPTHVESCLYLLN